jgi:hypothetical protein
LREFNKQSKRDDDTEHEASTPLPTVGPLWTVECIAQHPSESSVRDEMEPLVLETELRDGNRIRRRSKKRVIDDYRYDEGDPTPASPSREQRNTQTHFGTNVAQGN